MTGSKRPSTSSLRRFITSRPYVPVAELRRRFALDEPDAIWRIERDGEAAFIGLPEREATKIADLWSRDEIGVELSVEVRARVVVGIYPMRIARFVTDTNGYAHANGNGHPPAATNGHLPKEPDPAAAPPPRPAAPGPGRPAAVDPSRAASSADPR